MSASALGRSMQSSWPAPSRDAARLAPLFSTSVSLVEGILPRHSSPGECNKEPRGSNHMLGRWLRQLTRRAPTSPRHLLTGEHRRPAQQLLDKLTHVTAGAMRRPGPAGQSGRLFCSAPFSRFEVLGGGQRGEVVFCCQSWVTKSIGNISSDHVADVWNGAAASDFRRSILDGSFEYCKADICPTCSRSTVRCSTSRMCRTRYCSTSSTKSSRCFPSGLGT